VSFRARPEIRAIVDEETDHVTEVMTGRQIIEAEDREAQVGFNPEQIEGIRE
jgi:hypothetical protein